MVKAIMIGKLLFTQDQIDHYLKQGYSEQEALVKASMELWHGDGRGRFIKQVYGKG